MNLDDIRRTIRMELLDERFMQTFNNMQNRQIDNRINQLNIRIDNINHSIPNLVNNLVVNALKNDSNIKESFNEALAKFQSNLKSSSSNLISNHQIDINKMNKQHIEDTLFAIKKSNPGKLQIEALRTEYDGRINKLEGQIKTQQNLNLLSFISPIVIGIIYIYQKK